jgi:polyhydroxyalkanoate synthesis regulator phasin
MSISIDVLQMLLPAIFSAGGAYYAVKSELRWLRADVDELKRRVEKLESNS